MRKALHAVRQSSMESLCPLAVQVPQQQKGHVDRLRAEEKWQSRARLTETSFGFLEAQKNEASSLLLPDKEPQMKTEEEVEDWHFEKPQVCIIFFFTVYTK